MMAVAAAWRGRTPDARELGPSKAGRGGGGPVGHGDALRDSPVACETVNLTWGRLSVAA